MDLYRYARPDEKFYLSPFKPRFITINLLVLRLTVWWNTPFVSLIIGPCWRSGTFKALQIYAGVKCDGSRTSALQNGQLGGTPEEQKQFVMTLTPKELASVRIHDVSRFIQYANMGGT